MKKTFYKPKYSVFVSWLLSYILILSMPIIFAGITYIQTEKVIENEINQSNTFLLKRTQQKMDSVLKDVEKLGNEIMFNFKIQNVLQYDGKLTGEQQYDITTAVKELSQYKLQNNSIASFYIYFINIDYVLSHNEAVDSEAFFRSNYNEGKEQYKNWCVSYQENYKGDYKVMPEDSTNDKGNKMITYIRSFPVRGEAKPRATLVIKIRESEFLKDAGGINLTNHGTVLILDKNNDIITSTGDTQPRVHFDYQKLSGPEGQPSTNFSSGKDVVSFISSEITDWKYISIISSDIYWEKAQYVRKFAFAALLLCLVLGGVLSYLLVRKNYNPLMKLVRFFENQGESRFMRKQNEYGFIENALSRELDERKKLSSQIRRQNKALKSSYISGLLKGRNTNLSELDSLADYDIVFETEYFAVLACYIENYGNIIEQDRDMNSSKAFELVQFIVSNVLEELINQNNIGYVTEVDDVLVCLINFRKSGVEDWKDKLSKIVTDAQDFIGKHYEINFLISASGLHETVAGIFDAYTQALQGMQYKKVSGMRDLLFYDEIAGLPKGDYYYPLEKEYQLINCIKVGEIERAQLLLEDIFKKNFDSTLLPVQTATCLMFDLVSTMIKALNEIGDEGRNAFLKELGPVELVLNCRSINEMRLKMEEVVEKFCTYVREKNTSTNLPEKVTAYVRKNYSDGNLSVASIAEYFKMHPVYLSKEFKDKSGISILELIHKVRIEKAKQLMNNKATLEEIAKATGYSNLRTFTRSFVKVEGVTPGKFRGAE